MARPKGSKNKRTQAYLNKQSLAGDLPLDYMLRVMRDETCTAERRDEMAKAAAPYCHAKLASVQHTGEGGGPVQVTIKQFVLNDRAAK